MQEMDILINSLTQADYELVTPFFEQMINTGISPEKAAAYLYVAGRMRQKAEDKKERKARQAYWEQKKSEQKQIKLSQPEATKEGRKENVSR